MRDFAAFRKLFSMSKEIYLDGNATTCVLPAAIDAAVQAMRDCFGNPSSTHGTGLKAKALLDQVRARAKRLLGVGSGRIMFNSGATEGSRYTVACSDFTSGKTAGYRPARVQAPLQHPDMGRTNRQATVAGRRIAFGFGLNNDTSGTRQGTLRVDASDAQPGRPSAGKDS